ncbi:DUF6925 family protein [Sphingomonas profundi]|uniref:DUF6925 family protein n=1 Tax=Alterirhizorhabdus profundi TaxID=2681549 RepID=UPI0018D0801A|nr:hypothetical protein [Sphingomonas profundi]
MEPASLELLGTLVRDPANGWSIGSFGAIGEFVRDADEPASIEESDRRIETTTARGAMRISTVEPLRPIAWDGLAADGEGWSHTLAFCIPRPATAGRTIRRLGADRDAIRESDRDAMLFDLGVGSGAVGMCLRTADRALAEAMIAAEGVPLLSVPALMGEVLRAQPHRVLLSPAGRIEVFQPIPPPGGKSPAGPHTHLLPKLIGTDRPHSANVPIPDDLQSALSMHPRSPWRTPLGEKQPYDPATDRAFAPMLARYGLADDAAVDAGLLDALRRRAAPELAGWPATRRGRTRARILLRRLAAAGDGRVKPWRILHDRAPVESEEGEEA